MYQFVDQPTNCLSRGSQLVLWQCEAGRASSTADVARLQRWHQGSSGSVSSTRCHRFIK